jgi:hypothetical protein
MTDTKTDQFLIGKKPKYCSGGTENGKILTQLSVLYFLCKERTRKITKIEELQRRKVKVGKEKEQASDRAT